MEFLLDIRTLCIIIVILSFTYFFSTNKNIFKLFGVKEWEPGRDKRKMGSNVK